MFTGHGSTVEIASPQQVVFVPIAQTNGLRVLKLNESFFVYKRREGPKWSRFTASAVHTALAGVQGIFTSPAWTTFRGRVLTDGIVTCPWHGAQFNVKDGQVRRSPAQRPRSVSFYPVRITNGAVEVEVQRHMSAATS